MTKNEAMRLLESHMRTCKDENIKKMLKKTIKQMKDNVPKRWMKLYTDTPETQVQYVHKERTFTDLDDFFIERESVHPLANKSIQDVFLSSFVNDDMISKLERNNHPNVKLISPVSRQVVRDMSNAVDTWLKIFQYKSVSGQSLNKQQRCLGWGVDRNGELNYKGDTYGCKKLSYNEVKEMVERWGPSTRSMLCIRLERECIEFKYLLKPWTYCQSGKSVIVTNGRFYANDKNYKDKLKIEDEFQLEVVREKAGDLTNKRSK